MQAKKSIALLVSALIILGLEFSMALAVEAKAAHLRGDGDTGDRNGLAYEWDPCDYDDPANGGNGNGAIEKAEAIVAINCFELVIPKKLEVEVVMLYCEGGGC